MLAKNKCNEVTWLLDCESIINNKLLHQMTKITKCPTLRIDLNVITRSTSGWVESSHSNSNAREKKKLHWLIGRLTKIFWKMQFLIRYTGSWYVFRKCLRTYTIYPLASLSSPWLTDGHAWSHTPSSNTSLKLRLTVLLLFLPGLQLLIQAFALG